jgi:hypothetical protein
MCPRITPTVPISQPLKTQHPFPFAFSSTDGNSAIKIRSPNPSIRCDSDLMDISMESVSSCPLTVIIARLCCELVRPSVSHGWLKTTTECCKPFGRHLSGPGRPGDWPAPECFPSPTLPSPTRWPTLHSSVCR